MSADVTPPSPLLLSGGGIKGGLAGLAIRRPVTIGMLFLSLTVVGLVALRLVPLRLLPEGVNPPFLWVWITYPNASPLENQERIAEPVEDILATVKGVKEIDSRSGAGGCGVWIEFTQATDMDVAYLAVRDRLTRVRSELPDDVRYIFIRRYNESDEPVLYFGISVAGNYDDPNRLVQDEVVKRLERVDGVAAVEMWGGDAKIVRIELQLDRLKAHNVEVGGLIRRLRSADFALSAGTLEDGGRRLMVRADGRLKDLRQLEEQPLEGGRLQLKDVASVAYEVPPKQWVQRIGRQDAIQMGVMKESEANTVEVNQRLLAEIAKMESDPRLAGLTFDVLFDQGKYIRESLQNLTNSGLWGGLFAIVVLYYFLRRVRMTLFVTSAIPVCMLATIAYIYFISWSLDIVTLSGLMICVGMVVDNAIVVVENISALKQRGVSNLDAAVRGTSGVALAITLATGTTIVVFLPIMLMSGDRMFSFYMLRIGMPVVVALSASLFVALLFIPLAVQRFALESVPKDRPAIIRVERWIETVVRWTLKHRRDAFLILLLSLATTLLPMSKVVSTDQEEGNINDVMIRFKFPGYYSLDDIDRLMKEVEDFLYQRREPYDIKTVVTGFRRGMGRMRVFLNEPPKRAWLTHSSATLLRAVGLAKSSHKERREIIKELKDSLRVAPGVEMFTSWRRGAGEEDVEYVTIYGEDTRRLQQIVEDVGRRLGTIPNVLSIETDLEATADEVRIAFDRDETSRRRVDPAAAAFGLTALIRGIDLPEQEMEGRLIPVRAELREEDRTTLDQIRNLPVGSLALPAVRLDDVARFQTTKGLGEITRENRRTRIRLKVTFAGGDIGSLSESIDGALGGLLLPPGYEWGKGRHFEEVMEASRQRNQAWILALTFVLLLMGALFESFLLPIAVIVTVPFSFFGVWWTLWLTGTQFGLMAGVGVVILIGVVVNNAIVLVDRVNRLRDEGMSRDEALAIGSRERLRPIAMTALTTIFGLLPMAMGSASLIGIPYAPMGRAMIGGMLTATVTTPIVVPLAYSYLDDMKQWLGRVTAAIAGR